MTDGHLSSDTMAPKGWTNGLKEGILKLSSLLGSWMFLKLKLWQWEGKEAQNALTKRPAADLVQFPADPPELQAVAHNAQAPGGGRPVKLHPLVGANQHADRV